MRKDVAVWEWAAASFFDNRHIYKLVEPENFVQLLKYFIFF